MSRRLALAIVAISALSMALYSRTDAAAPDRPNVILIYSDDIGYGDVSCYGADRVKTEHIDRLAAEGLRFTDGHSPSATCTPSRYTLLTGEYAWRRKGTGIARGNAPLIIHPDRYTLADAMRAAGYKTSVVGKWHLGLGSGDLDWNGPIRPGPLELGFHECFLIPATGDRTPCVYVENDRVVGLDPKDPIRVGYRKPVGDDPTGKSHPQLLKMKPSHGHNQTIVNGISRIGTMSGGHKARWKDEDMADVITEKAVEFIERSKDAPFFLFFSTHDNHVPRVPHPRFVGKTPMGPRGDAIAQLDDCVGRILETLDRLELTKDTIVIFTSDNGPVVNDGYQDDAVEKLGDHKPAGPWRGGKYSNFEGGTRVPFIVRWPARVKQGETDALVSHADFFASLARLLGAPLPNEAAPDSVDVLDALTGESSKGREMLVEHARGLSLRQGSWKYIAPGRGPKINRNTNTELGTDPEGQLYDLATDPGETKNLAKSRPKKAAELAEILKTLRERGRSRN